MRSLLALALLSACGIAQAQTSSYNYRGSLNDGGQPANGRYDLRLSLLDDKDGVALLSPITLYAVEVVNGQFVVPVDFGIDLSQAQVMRLQTEVQQGGNGFVPLGEPSRFDPKAALGGLCWALDGNAGSNPALDFLGTTDNQPLVLRTQNVQSLRIEPSASTFNGDPITANVIAGSSANAVLAGATGATISGGGQLQGSGSVGANRVAGSFGSIGGGLNNLIGDPLGNPSTDGIVAVIGGGQSNTATGALSTISGGGSNAATQFVATVGGGQNNLASGAFSTVGGGEDNLASGGASTVGGGQNNLASDEASTVGGGFSNAASGFDSTVGGGASNTASGTSSTVGGGTLNTASGIFSTVGGGNFNCAGGSFAWAGGRRAKVRPGTDPGAGTPCGGLTYPGGFGDSGSFVWADSQEVDFVSTGANQFLVRATSGFGLNTNIPTPSHLTIGKDDGSSNTLALGYFGDVTRWRISGPDAGGSGSAFEVQSGGNQVLLRVEDVGPSSRVGISRTATVNALEVEGNASKTTAGSWLANSDARIKTEVREIDGALERLMAVRPVTFRYTPEYRAAHPGLADQRYYNVIAQEFAQSFPDAVKGSGEFLPGQNESSATEILQVDIHPALITAIAAIQGLNQKLEAENAALRAQLAVRDAALATQAADFESRLRALEQSR